MSLDAVCDCLCDGVWCSMCCCACVFVYCVLCGLFLSYCVVLYGLCFCELCFLHVCLLCLIKYV